MISSILNSMRLAMGNQWSSRRTDSTLSRFLDVNLTAEFCIRCSLVLRQFIQQTVAVIQPGSNKSMNETLHGLKITVFPYLADRVNGQRCRATDIANMFSHSKFIVQHNSKITSIMI